MPSGLKADPLKSAFKRFPILPSFFFFLIEAFWVWGAESNGYRADILFGHRFVKYYVFPVGFWAVAFLFALGFSIFKNEALRIWVCRVIPLGLLVHLVLLLGQFLYERKSVSLNARYFSFYCDTVALLGICISLFVLWKYFLESKGHTPITGLQFPHLFKMPVFWLSVIFGISLFFRVTAALRLSGMGLEIVLLNSDDAQSYHRDALLFLKGNKIEGYFSIGETLMVAYLIKLFSGEIRGMLLTQAFLCSFLPVLVYFMAVRMTSKPISLLCALGSALSQLLIFNAVNLTRESFGGLFIVASMLSFFVLWESHSSKQKILWGSIFGVLVGFTYLFDISLQIAFLALTLLFVLRKFERRMVWARVSWLLFLMFLPKLVSAAVTWHATSKFHFFGRDISAAHALNISYSPEAYKLWSERHIEIFLDPFGSFVAYFRDPIGNSELMLRKWRNDFLYYFFEGFSGAFDPLILVRISTLAGNMNFYLYLFGFLGFFHMLFESWREPFAVPARTGLLIFMFCAATPYIFLFLGHTRYRVAIQPFIIICCVSGLVGFLLKISKWASDSQRLSHRWFLRSAEVS